MNNTSRTRTRPALLTAAGLALTAMPLAAIAQMAQSVPAGAKVLLALRSGVNTRSAQHPLPKPEKQRMLCPPGGLGCP